MVVPDQGKTAMPAPKIRADHEALAMIAQRFLTEADRTHQTMAGLLRCADVLTAGDWVGRGAAAFNREMESDVLPAVGRLEGALLEAGRLTTQISQVMKQAEVEAAALFRAPPAQIPTPIVTPSPLPPVPARTPTPQPPRDPFFDPLANDNRYVTTQLRFMEPPFSLLEGNPNDPPIYLAGNKLALLLQAIRGFTRAALPFANADAMASVEPNVDVSLHFSTYDDGVRIPGIRIENHSEVPAVIGRAEIELWRMVGPEHIPMREDSFAQDVVLVVPPGGSEDLHFDVADMTFPPDGRVDIHVVAAGLTANPALGQIGWSVSGLGGAIGLPPGQ